MNEQQIIETLATKVMGWHKIPSPRVGAYAFRCPHPHDRHLFRDTLWNPLQNIADAWQVVEKIINNGFDVEVYSGKDFSVCNVYESSQGIEMAECEEETVCLAICNATLKVFDWSDDLTQR